jgi:Ala-tRNA(Pro) deacylase
MIDRLRRSLDDANVPYETLVHREAFTAQEIAANTHVSGRQLAKTLILKADSGRLYMAVIPASSRLDFDELAPLTGERRLSLAGEQEFASSFPDCETGAMPPFGGLYGIPVYVDRSFASVRDIVFEAGNHHEAVRMRFSDYTKVANPVIGQFSYPWISPLQPEMEEL